MPEWKKLLKEQPAAADLKTSPAAGKVLGVAADNATLEWKDDIGIDVVSSAPTTAAEFPKGAGTFVLHSSGSGISGDNALYFLTNDGYSIVKIAADTISTNLGFDVLTFTHDGGSSPQLIGSGVWQATGDLDFNFTYDNPVSVTGEVVDVENNNAVICADISSGTIYSDDNDNSILFPTTAEDKIHLQVNASNNDGGTVTTASKLASEVQFLNYFYAGHNATGTQTDTLIRALEKNILREASDLLNFSAAISVAAGSGDYLVVAWPKRAGQLSASKVLTAGESNSVVGVNGRVRVGFDASHTPMTETNFNNHQGGGSGTGFQEDLYIYRSATGTSINDNTIYINVENSSGARNYIYVGITDQAHDGTWTSGRILGDTGNNTLHTKWAPSASSTSDVDQKDTHTWPNNSGSLTVTATANRVYFAIPASYSNSDSLAFWDYYAGFFGFGMDKRSSVVSVTNMYGYVEDYIVYVSTNALYDAGEDNLIRFSTTIV